MSQLMGQTNWNKNFLFNGEVRKYTLYVPASYDPVAGAPLIVSIHGYRQLVTSYRNLMDLDSIADAEGFMVLYPYGDTCYLPINPMPGCLQGVGFGWNIPGFINGWHDDAQFVEQCVDSAIASHNVDEKRIYAVGLSNGGMLATKLAETMNDRLAGVVSVIGHIGTAPSNKIPYMAIMATEDPIYDVDGVPGQLPSWNNIISDWASANSCSNSFTSIWLPDVVPSDSCTVEVQQYDNCGEPRGELRVMKIHGGGHIPPGATNFFPSSHPCAALGNGVLDFNPAEVAWDFLEPHSLDDMVSIDHEVSSAVKVYPNPFADELRFEIDGLQGMYKLVIRDLSGKEVTTFTGDEGEKLLIVNTSILRAGLYIYEFQTGSEMKYGKLIKK
jgi:polyhydroxybutyrate depolymerase